MSNIAVIGIKTDSKGVKMKAFRYFCGLPLYHWVFQAATDCKYIDKIVLSCTEKWVYDDVKKHFPKIIWVKRPKGLNGETELLEVTKHAFKKVAKKGDTCIQLQISKPLTTAKLLDEIIEYYNKDRYIEFCYEFGKNGMAKWIDRKANGIDSLFTVQEIKTAVNGEYKQAKQLGKKNYKSMAVCKIWSYDTIMNAEKGTWGKGKNHYDYVVDDRHIEIDTELDFQIAEALKKAGL